MKNLWKLRLNQTATVLNKHIHFIIGFVLITHVPCASLTGATPFPVRGFSKILSSQEAEEKLSEYRSFISGSSVDSSFHNAYSFKFKLRHMPRRGPETSKYGEISGPLLGSGVFRLQIFDSGQSGQRTILLLSNPENPRISRLISGIEGVSSLQKNFLFEEVCKGMNLTFFDLLMPFVFWPEEYVKSGKVSGRPAHLYQFTTPDWVKNTRPKWERIIMALDDVYSIPLRVEVFSNEKRLRTISLRSFKKTGTDWIVKSSDCRNEEDRSTTRLEILSAATGLDLASDFFTETGFIQSFNLPIESYQNFE